MQKCSNCGADLAENSRFCGQCGSVQDALATEGATRNTPPPQSWETESGTLPAGLYSNDPIQSSGPDWPPYVQAPETSPPYDVALGGGALMGSGQAFTPGAPPVQGTPQIGSVPSVAGSPTPYMNPSAGHPMLGAGNAPASPPVPTAGNTAIGQPMQGSSSMPVSHPAQGAGNVPVSHPVQQPLPRPQPPEEPGSHKPHGPHSHPEEPEQHRHHDHKAQHELHRVGKVAGGSSVKTVLLVVTAVVVVAAGGIGAAAHFLAHPQPIISISSNYKVGTTPAGANGTVLHISGQNFSSNSVITFLLDGHAVPGNPVTHSDSNGDFSANVAITSAWSAGTHTLTARDTSNDSPKSGVSVTVVQPGQANTPGPNGEPPDDASFRIKVSNADNIADPFSQNTALIITGHPDPQGGTVCAPDDNGQSFTFNETTTDGTPFTKTLTATCSGTYKAGQINFTETSTSVKAVWQDNGLTINCVVQNTVDLQLTGTYVGNNTFSGKISSPTFQYTCDQQGYSFTHYGTQGASWTGQVTDLHA